MASLQRIFKSVVILQPPKPAKPVTPLLEMCLIFLSRNLHVELIKIRLPHLPKIHLTAIQEKLVALGINCGFTDAIFECAFEGGNESLPTWAEWCQNVVTKSTEIRKCVVIICFKNEVVEWVSSKEFAITNEEVKSVPNVVGENSYYSNGHALVFEGKKYILFNSNHPSMVFGDLLDANNVSNAVDAEDSSCIIAKVKINAEQRMLVGVLSSFKYSLIPRILSLQKMAEELTHCCRYLAEYFAYINGENPNTASQKFV